MTDLTPYTDPSVSDDEDDGTMPENVATLAEEIVGHRIVKVDRDAVAEIDRYPGATYNYTERLHGLALTLDNGTVVHLADTDDCCAYTELEDVIEHLPTVDHIITNVTTTEGYTRWHILADLGEVLELKVGWSSGNPFYYGYGFDINVVEQP